MESSTEWTCARLLELLRRFDALAASHEAPGIKQGQLALFIQPVDETVVIEFFDQTVIDEIFRARGARFGVFFAELSERFFDGLERRIGFLRHQAGEAL